MSLPDELEAIRKAVYGDGPIIMNSLRNRPIGDIPGIPKPVVRHSCAECNGLFPIEEVVACVDMASYHRHWGKQVDKYLCNQCHDTLMYGTAHIN